MKQIADPLYEPEASMMSANQRSIADDISVFCKANDFSFRPVLFIQFDFSGIMQYSPQDNRLPEKNRPPYEITPFGRESFSTSRIQLAENERVRASHVSHCGISSFSFIL